LINNYKNKKKTNKTGNNNFNENNSFIEEELLSLKNTLTPNEFFNSIKSGFELALCKKYKYKYKYYV